MAADADQPTTPIPAGFRRAPCPDCWAKAGGCGVCEGTGYVLMAAHAAITAPSPISVRRCRHCGEAGEHAAGCSSDVRLDSSPSTVAGPSTASSPPTEERAEAEARTDIDAPATAKRSGLFGGLTPSEAARLRWEQVRAREARTAEDDALDHEDDALIVRVSVQVGQIIRRLAKDAKGGNVQSARELRAYLADVAQDSETSVAALDRKTQQQVLARLLDEIAEEDAAQAQAEQGLDAALLAAGVTDAHVLAALHAVEQGHVQALTQGQADAHAPIE